MGREEVGWPPYVLIPEVTVYRHEAGAGTRGQPDRANDARFKAGTPDVREFVPGKDRELRVEPRTMTGLPAASGWPASSDAYGLARR